MPASGDVTHISASHFMYSKAQEEQFNRNYSLVHTTITINTTNYQYLVSYFFNDCQPASEIPLQFG